MKKQTRHSFGYWQWRVIICSMIGYAMFYFVRKNFSFAIPLIQQAYPEITKAHFGAIISAGGVIYGISKLLNGIIADRSNARWHLAIGLGVCVLANVAFGFTGTLTTLITGATGVLFVIATLRDTPRSVGLPELPAIRGEYSSDKEAGSALFFSLPCSPSQDSSSMVPRPLPASSRPMKCPRGALQLLSAVAVLGFLHIVTLWNLKDKALED